MVTEDSLSDGVAEVGQQKRWRLCKWLDSKHNKHDLPLGLD